ncbi:dol-P-Glc:Glc(2)Man(9)GlcNAc(2)-PP-Dol alpha-1,2-glucosyltransferase [Epargyreus clarus]|uniref:dol-P-Glc:Glc(2)Man(9)GlcNAc(2)-PP-Dol alpha-1,2-glucosyltransferase n=1 Tax=Epargyreus clarus TaxID=520877 RepID=UPI003C2C0CBF
MDLLSRNHIFIYAMIGLYMGCSIPVFDKVYNTLKVVIDEKFHIPQAQAYCNGQFDVWDPKITTLPGLYLAAAKFVSPILPCTTYNLRFFNLVISGINMGLIYIILNIVYGHSCSRFNLTLQALNMVLLPPLYFFAHVFYTDVLSLMCLLVFTIAAIKRYRIMILIFGLASIGCRQTNAIWILMFFSQKLCEIALKASRVYGNVKIEHNKSIKKNSSMYHVLDRSALKRTYDYEDGYHVFSMPFDRLYKSMIHNEELLTDLQHCMVLFVPVLAFGLFVLYNGSIVVGDKSAHTMTLNSPQSLYFLLFYGFFGLPFVLARFKSTMKFMLQNKLVALELAVTSAICVHFNTVAHPYLLADNRHYTFYIWNRWFGRYPAAPYLTIPVYVFLTFSLLDTLRTQNCISFLLAYYPSLMLGTALQRLLEIRYFIVPYFVARLRFPKSPNWLIICEFLWYMAINVATFTIFFTKEVKWEEFEEPQRIIW